MGTCMLCSRLLGCWPSEQKHLRAASHASGPYQMSSKADVSAANVELELVRRQLVSHWEKTLDEEGNFEHTFGDPLATPYAIKIWIGYDENDEVKVDIVYPASENALAVQEPVLDDRDLSTIESLAYDNAHLLDTDIPRFANIISNHLAGLYPHESLNDPLWDALEVAKQKASSVAASYKQKLQEDSSSHKNQTQIDLKSAKKKNMLHRQYLQAMERARRYAEDQRIAKERREAKAKAQEVEKERDENFRDQKIRQSLDRLYSPETGIKRSGQANAFVYYLERVFGLESHMILYQNHGISNLPLHSHPMLRHFDLVQELNLSHNSIVVLPQEIFSMANLKRVYLHDNHLKVLPPSFGECASNIEVLDLHNNQIISLPQDFGMLTKLQSLDLERNRLRTIPDDIEKMHSSLQHLNLASNLVKILPPIMGGLTRLSYLNLKNNPIVNLPPHIYLQGPSAAMQFLRDQTSSSSSSSSQDSSLTHDISLILASSSSSSNESPILTDLILQSNDEHSSADGGKDPEISAEISNFSQNGCETPGLPFQVHTSVVAARCPAIANLLLTASEKQLLQKHPTLGLPVLPLNVSSKQLAILITYLYSDSYHKPELPLLIVSTDMTEEQVVDTVKQNQVITAAFQATLSRASCTASRFNLPHMQYLIDQHFKQAIVVESRFVADMKTLFGKISAPEAADPPLSSEESSSSSDSNNIPSANPDEEEASRILHIVAPFDVSFSFPLSPEYPQVHAHKSILCARSKFMRSMLTGGLKESKERVVEIVDIHPLVFANIIEFCYTDDVEELNGETIMELMTAARLYGLDRLLDIVQSVVGYSLDSNNVCGIMTTAALYALPKLSRACKFFVLSNWESVTRTSSWIETPRALRDKLTSTALEWGVIGSS